MRSTDPRLSRLRLGDILLGARLITREQLQEGLALQQAGGGRLGERLVELGHLSEPDLDGDGAGARLYDLGRDDGSTVVRLVNIVCREAIDARASDIHIEPPEDRVQYRVDGALLESNPLPLSLHGGLM